MNYRWRILVLSRYGSAGASSRLRFMQYFPFLERAGAAITVSAFFDDESVKHFYATTKRRSSDVLSAYTRRIRSVMTARRYSLIWIEKEVFPFLPGDLNVLLAVSGVPYVVDYDDAIFHGYDLHSSWLVRRCLSNKLNALLANAQHVTVGNGYLESYVRSHGAREVTQVPTVVDVARYTVHPEPNPDELRIGWIGSPATAKYLYLVRDSLIALGQRRRVKLVTIGAPPLADYGVPIEQHPWTEATENELLGSIHLGIMPLPDEHWERGKCGYKLIQYMAAGRPVVASAVGINRDIVKSDVGYLAPTQQGWVDAIDNLGNDHSKRRACGIAARHLVERKYSLQVTAPLVVSVLQSAGERITQ